MLTRFVGCLHVSQPPDEGPQLRPSLMHTPDGACQPPATDVEVQNEETVSDICLSCFQKGFKVVYNGMGTDISFVT